jgi:predicted lipid carrier protein YhbT
MAQETVIHRVDAELAAGLPVSPIPDDLALDGVDEVLERFLAYGSRMWQEDFGKLLDDLDGRAVRVVAGDRSWVAAMANDGVTVSAHGDSAASVSGAPQPLLLWLWRRAGDADVAVDGDAALVAKLRELLGAATQ